MHWVAVPSSGLVELRVPEGAGAVAGVDLDISGLLVPAPYPLSVDVVGSVDVGVVLPHQWAPARSNREVVPLWRPPPAGPPTRPPSVFRLGFDPRDTAHWKCVMARLLLVPAE